LPSTTTVSSDWAMVAPFQVAFMRSRYGVVGATTVSDLAA
jgi:hypothetical protein